VTDAKALESALRAACDPARRKYLASYFETESRTRYRGLTATAARRVAVRYADRFRLPALRRLLASAVPEHRFVALEMMVRQYETGGPAQRAAIARVYIGNLDRVDHWVLVDTSAPYILGDHLLKRRRTLLYRLAAARELARRRIAIVATWAFIRAGDFDDTLRIASLLLHDREPLIHRAVGWMLREVGKRSPAAAERFLLKHHRIMPRLMLRYSLEWLPAAGRKKYLTPQSERRADSVAIR